MPDKNWYPAYVGIGSNLDGPRNRVETALQSLDGIARTRLVRHSALYGSPAMGPPGQPDYVNAVAALLTQLSPEALLRALQALEIDQGRVRDSSRWGSRHIDLDLLVHGDNVREGPTLVLPHPGLSERAFVLQPLAELAPALRLPDGRQIAGLSGRIDCSELWRL